MTRYFVSGHMNLQDHEFQQHYVGLLTAAAAAVNSIGGLSTFVLGNAVGADTMALHYLVNELAVSPDRIHLYVYNYYPNKQRKEILRLQQLGIKNIRTGFPNVHARDAAMTENSDVDLLWVRSEEGNKQLLGSKFKPNHISGTEKNRLRRLLTVNTD